jgi:ssDNA-specific exonuclease RecJ
MPEAAGKSEDRVKKAAAILVKRLVPVQNQKDILEFFKNELALYISKTPNAEEFAEVYQFLDTKIDTLLQKDSTELLNSL